MRFRCSGKRRSSCKFKTLDVRRPSFELRQSWNSIPRYDAADWNLVILLRKNQTPPVESQGQNRSNGRDVVRPSALRGSSHVSGRVEDEYQTSKDSGLSCRHCTLHLLFPPSCGAAAILPPYGRGAGGTCLLENTF